MRWRLSCEQFSVRPGFHSQSWVETELLSYQGMKEYHPRTNLYVLFPGRTTSRNVHSYSYSAELLSNEFLFETVREGQLPNWWPVKTLNFPSFDLKWNVAIRPGIVV